MAKLPKIYFNGVRVKTFKYNGVEVFEATFKDPNTNQVVCYHKHKGTAGQTTPNGCYQKKTITGGYCRGYTYELPTSWSCGWCGTVVEGRSKPSDCPNNVCGSGTGGQRWNVKTTQSYTGYHSNKSECSEWTETYQYDLNCGYDAE